MHACTQSMPWKAVEVASGKGEERGEDKAKEESETWAPSNFDFSSSFFLRSVVSWR